MTTGIPKYHDKSKYLSKGSWRWVIWPHILRYIPEGADRPAPDNTMMFLEDSRTFLNSVISEEGAIDWRHSISFCKIEGEKAMDLLRSKWLLSSWSFWLVYIYDVRLSFLGTRYNTKPKIDWTRLSSSAVLARPSQKPNCFFPCKKCESGKLKENSVPVHVGAVTASAVNFHHRGSIHDSTCTVNVSHWILNSQELQLESLDF